MKITEAAKMLSINLSTAKTIVRNFIITGRMTAKKPIRKKFMKNQFISSSSKKRIDRKKFFHTPQYLSQSNEKATALQLPTFQKSFDSFERNSEGENQNGTTVGISNLSQEARRFINFNYCTRSIIIFSPIIFFILIKII